MIVSAPVLGWLLPEEKLKNAAIMVTVAGDCTVLVVTLKLAEAAPAGTTTLPGIVIMPLGLADSNIVCPPAGAVPFKVTVPVTLAPLITDEGDKVSAEIEMGLIASTAVL